MTNESKPKACNVLEKAKRISGGARFKLVQTKYFKSTMTNDDYLKELNFASGRLSAANQIIDFIRNDKTETTMTNIYSVKEALQLLVFDRKILEAFYPDNSTFVLYRIRYVGGIKPFEVSIKATEFSKWAEGYFPDNQNTLRFREVNNVKTVTGEEALRAYKEGKYIKRDGFRYHKDVKDYPWILQPDFTQDNWEIID